MLLIDNDEELGDLNESQMSVKTREYVASVKRGMVATAKDHVRSWFQQQNVEIEQETMDDPKTVSMVLNTTIANAVQKAYEKLEQRIDPVELRKANQFGTVTDDIILVYETLTKLAQARIPKQFAGGILLMHLEYCHGVEF